MKRVFSKSFRENLRQSKNSVEVAGSGVTNVFSSTRKISSGSSDGAKWLKHVASFIYYKSRRGNPLVLPVLLTQNRISSTDPPMLYHLCSVLIIMLSL